MIKSLNKKLLYRSIASGSIPLCANVFDYSGNGGSSGGTFSRLNPSCDCGLSASGNTIGFLQESFVPAVVENRARLLFGLNKVHFDNYATQDVFLSVKFSESNPVEIVTPASFSGRYRAGSEGFYFRNQTDSSYYYMLGRRGQDTRVLTVVAVPNSKNPFQSVLSDSNGVEFSFNLESGPTGLMQRDLPADVNMNNYFSATARSVQEYVTGTLLPLTPDVQFKLGTIEYVNNPDTSDYFTVKRDPSLCVTDVRYVSFS